MSEEAKTRATLPVSLPSDIVQQLRVIAAHRGEHMGELLDPLIREWVRKEHRKTVREMNLAISGENGGA